MSWERYDDGGARWTWTGDDERHLLLLSSTELREYHEQPDGPPTVHVYTPDLDAIADGFGPLQHAEWQSTYAVADKFAPWVRALDDRELFDWLESAGYAS